MTTDPYAINPMKGPEVFVNPTGVTVYQEGKTVLPENKVGLGYSGFNFEAVGQTAAKVAGDIYTQYKNEQFGDKELLLKNEQQDLQDRLEVYAYRNDWKEAEAEKDRHRKRVDTILGWDLNSEGGGVAAKRLNAFARTIGSDYAAKVAVGSMRDKDNVENDLVDVAGAQFEAIVKGTSDPAERGRILDGQVLFTNQELNRLGVKRDKNGNPMINEETLVGKSQVQRAHIFKLEHMRVKAQEDKALYAAKDYEAGQKSLIEGARNALVGPTQASQEWGNRLAVLADLEKERVKSGGAPTKEYVKLRNELGRDFVSTQNLIHATVRALLIQGGYNPEDFTDPKTQKFDMGKAETELARTLQGDSAVALLGSISNLNEQMKKFDESDLKRMVSVLNAQDEAAYAEQTKRNKNLALSAEDKFKAIDASSDSDFVKAQRKNQVLGALEHDMIASFDYLQPKPTTGTAGRDGLMRSTEEDELNYIASIPGLELDSAINSLGLIDNNRFAEYPVYSQNAFQDAWKEFNKVKSLVYKDGNSTAGSKRQAEKAAELAALSVVIRTETPDSRNTNVTAQQTRDSAQFELSRIGIVSDTSAADIPKLLQKNKATEGGVQIDTQQVLNARPDIIPFLLMSGDATVGADVKAALQTILDSTVTDVPAQGMAVRGSHVEASKELKDAIRNSVLSGFTNGARLNTTNLTAMVVTLPPSQSADVLAHLMSDPAYTNTNASVYRYNVQRLALAVEQHKGGDPLAFALDFDSRYDGVSEASLVELFAIRSAMEDYATKQLDSKNVDQMTPENQARFARAQMFKGIISGNVPKLTLVGATDVRLDMSRLSASDISAPSMVGVINQAFMDSLEVEVAFGKKKLQPNEILSNPEAMARVTQRVQADLSKRFVVQETKIGERFFVPAPPTVEDNMPSPVNPAFFGKAGASVSTGKNEGMVLGLSNSVDSFQNSPVDFVRQFTSNQTQQAMDAFAADPIYSAVFSGVPRGTTPVFSGTDKAGSDRALFEAATQGKDNYSILIAQAVLNTHKFDPTASKEDTLAAVAQRAANIRKGIENPGSDSEMFVEFHSTPANNGTGYTTKMVIVSGNKVVASMEPNASSVDAGVSSRISYKGMDQSRLQGLMESDTRQYGSDLSDPHSGNEMIIAKWFKDNPEQNSVQIVRNVVDAKANDGQDGFMANTARWMSNVLSPKQPFVYTRGTNEDGSQVLLKNSYPVPFITLRGPNTERPAFVKQVQDQREAVRRAGLTQDQRDYEDSAKFWTGYKDTSKPQWSWGQYGEGVSTSSYLPSNAPNAHPNYRGSGSHTFTRHPVGPIANYPMESIDNEPYNGSANKPMDVNADNNGKLYKLTSLPNTPMDLGSLGTTPTAYFNMGGPKANTAMDTNPLLYYRFNMGGPKANTPINTNPDYNPGLTANSPIYLGD